MAPGGVEPPRTDSKFGPEPRRAETQPRRSRLSEAVSGWIVAFVISAHLGGSGGPDGGPAEQPASESVQRHHVEHLATGEGARTGREVRHRRMIALCDRISRPAPSPSSSRDVEGSTKLLHELGCGGVRGRPRRAPADRARGVRGRGRRRGRQPGRRVLLRVPLGAGGARRGAGDDATRSAAGRIQVRIGLHTGTPLVTEEGYVGDDVHLAARVGASGARRPGRALAGDPRARRRARCSPISASIA